MRAAWPKAGSRMLIAASAAVSLLGPLGVARAQSWPDRPIKFISSQSAGGATDVLGRLIADALAVRLGQPIVYENRTGGGNVVGTQAAARSAPDGNTFFFATAAALVTDPYTFKSLPYDPAKDFAIVSDIAEVSFMVLAHPDVPTKSLAELFAYARANPGKLTAVTDGNRRFSGMIVAWLNKLAGTDIAAVPYTQMTQGVQDALAGRVQLIVLAAPAARGHIAAGSLRPLAVTTAKRLQDFPDVPAAAETFAGFDFGGWFVLAAPTGVPEPVLARVNRDMAAVMTDPDIVKKLAAMGFVSHGGGDRKAATDYVERQRQAWGKLIKEIGLEPE